MAEFGEETDMEDVDFLKTLNRQREDWTERKRDRALARERKLHDVLWRVHIFPKK